MPNALLRSVRSKTSSHVAFLGSKRLIPLLISDTSSLSSSPSSSFSSVFVFVLFCFALAFAPKEIKERRRVSDLLEASSRSEISLRERLEATAGEGDLKARLTSARSKLESVSLERDALVSPPRPTLF